jgi:hypothetical protein
VTLSLDHGVELPYAHPSVAGVRALAGVLAPRESWSERDLARLTRRFATRAAEELHQSARFDRAERWHLRLALTAEVEVWLLTWTLWQGTEQHDHGGAIGAYTVLHGELTETWTDHRRPRTARTAFTLCRTSARWRRSACMRTRRRVCRLPGLT